MNALAHVMEEVPAPESTAERDVARALAESVANGSADVVVREADGTEHVLPAGEVRAWLALLVARAQGQKVLVVGEEEQISPQQAADLLGISRPMVYRLIDRGDLPATMVGTHRRLRVGDVLGVARKRAALARSVDSGFASALRAGTATREAGDTVTDAKAAWQAATDEQREAAIERTAKRAARRRAR